MVIRKKVTEKKLAANRENAKRSTGPRTERGKSVVRFNAVVLGLFAQEMFVPAFDHVEYSDFDRLLKNLVNELQPEGTLEIFYVSEMAKSMWKIRRASLAENTSAYREAQTTQERTDTALILFNLKAALKILKDAEEEIVAGRNSKRLRSSYQDNTS